jgi:hypothetical protein
MEAKESKQVSTGLATRREIPVGDSQQHGTNQWSSVSHTDLDGWRNNSAEETTHWVETSPKQMVSEMRTTLAEHLIKQAVVLNNEGYWKTVEPQNPETNPFLNNRLQIIEDKMDNICRMVQQLILLVQGHAHTHCETLSRVTELEVLVVSKELGYKWKNVGRLLGVSNSSIEEISHRHPNSLQEQAYQCLWMWFGSDGSRQQLYQVLQEEGLTNVVEKLDKR